MFYCDARRCLIHVVAPLGLGGLVYLLFRPDTLIAFSWLRRLGLLPAAEVARAAAIPATKLVPEWCLMSLPAGLWCYALVIAATSVWTDRDTVQRSCWTVVAVAFALFSEVGQAFGAIPGHFSLVDLATDAMAVTVALFVSWWGGTHA